MGMKNGQQAAPAAPSEVDARANGDAALAQDIAAGDLRAFEQLMRKHNRRLFRAARAILKDDGEAEDALQEGYLQAFRAMSTFRGEARMSTWLTRIVANEAFGRLRKHARRAAILPLHSIDDEAAAEVEAASEAPAMERPDHAMLRDELRRLLETRIDALPDAYRVVFVLRAVEDLSVEETAQSLGLSDGAVRTRFFRARALLREALARDVDHACLDAFGFAGARCDRVVARVLARLADERDPTR
jgi:RNA polymerase sigma-70 factor (ECF subfamily)